MDRFVCFYDNKMRTNSILNGLWSGRGIRLPHLGNDPHNTLNV